MIMVCLCSILLVGGVSHTVDANPADVRINTNSEPAAGDRVRLDGDKIRIEADQLTYDIENGVITAEGNVIATTADAVYHTELIVYNTKDLSGEMTAFNGNIKAESRDLKLTGAGIKLSENATSMSEAGLTRCILEKPHYQLTAGEITVIGRVVHLRKVVIRLKGIPVFYLPKLSLNLDKKPPSLETGFNNEDGFKFKYNYLAALTSHWNWSLEGELTSRDESKMGLGLESVNTDYHNRLSLLYNFDNFWEFSDVFTYQNDDWLLKVDGTHQFSKKKESDFGVSLTRKYWETSLGRWQVGILAKDVSKEEDTVSYGGLYTGWRLDYNPYPNVVLSYLGITSHSGREYADLLTDNGYSLGDNWLYNISFPITGGGYSLGMNGVYNSDDAGWIHQIYSLRHESCCFTTYLGYDVTEESLELSWNIKF